MNNIFKVASLMELVVKNLPANAGDVKRHGFDPWVGKIPWKRACQPTPMFLPGESLELSLVGYSPQSCKELGLTEANYHVSTFQVYGYYYNE